MNSNKDENNKVDNIGINRHHHHIGDSDSQRVSLSVATSVYDLGFLSVMFWFCLVF